MDLDVFVMQALREARAKTPRQVTRRGGGPANRPGLTKPCERVTLTWKQGGHADPHEHEANEMLGVEGTFGSRGRGGEAPRRHLA